MAVIFTEGFDHLAITDLHDNVKWTVASTTVEYGGMVTGRFGGKAIDLGISGRISHCIEPTSDLIVGFATKIPNLPSSYRQIFRTLYQDSIQIVLAVDNCGRLFSYVKTLGLGSSVDNFEAERTAIATIVPGQWYYIEFRMVTDDDDGIVEIRVDETERLNLTGKDTNYWLGISGAPELMNEVEWIGTDHIIDDIYVIDRTTAPNNDYLGECRVITLHPNGDGDEGDFTASAGDNYAAVNETTPDDDTTYVESSTVGHVDLYRMSDMPITGLGSIAAVQVVTRAKKDDANPRGFNNVFKSGTQTRYGNPTALSTGYRSYIDIRETDPATDEAWTSDGVNDMQIGHKVNS